MLCLSVGNKKRSRHGKGRANAGGGREQSLGVSERVVERAFYLGNVPMHVPIVVSTSGDCLAPSMSPSMATKAPRLRPSPLAARVTHAEA